ncbi:MAG TPA: pyridoxamine 5'-phosphate oxidase [Rhodobacteraceae bacterium]|jgi:PPOX class probable FMN-dependent enzyme|nr:pyridoxamine 5'-phosphate oxidase [Paracoccaceae bacterium]
MEYIDNIKQIEEIYGTPGQAALLKVAKQMTPAYRDWIARSRFCVLSTVGPQGTDASPRGDIGPVVEILDDQTIALPDWSGNNRIDTLRNLVTDARIGMMFMVAGSNNVVRLNGTARITVDAETLARFDKNGKQPRVVIIIKISEIYVQCARALMRAGLWVDGDLSDGLPTVGQILKELDSGDFDGKSYDQNWAGRAKDTMW